MCVRLRTLQYLSSRHPTSVSDVGDYIWIYNNAFGRVLSNSGSTVRFSSPQTPPPNLPTTVANVFRRFWVHGCADSQAVCIRNSVILLLFCHPRLSLHYLFFSTAHSNFKTPSPKKAQTARCSGRITTSHPKSSAVGAARLRPLVMKPAVKSQPSATLQLRTPACPF